MDMLAKMGLTKMRSCEAFIHPLGDSNVCSYHHYVTIEFLNAKTN